MLSKDLYCLIFVTKGIFYKIVCSVGVGLSKHGYGKMTPKKAHVLVLGIFYKVHCTTTCKEFEE